MHNSLNNLISIKNEIYQINKQTKVIVVSKTFPIDNVMPLISYGHEDFGENKVQEAEKKWLSIKNDFPNLKLHMIGKLQTNKVKHVIPLFDYIHSLDNLKLAEKIAQEQSIKKKRIKIFIQVNIGEEDQKSGISIEKLPEFYSKCLKELNLDIIGLMCLPPIKKDPIFYFEKMKNLKNNLNCKELSMGMSNDYLLSTNHDATFVRIGSKILGKRN